MGVEALSPKVSSAGTTKNCAQNTGLEKLSLDVLEMHEILQLSTLFIQKAAYDI